MAVDRTRAAARRRMYLHMLLRSVSVRRSRVLIAVLAIAVGATTLAGLVTISIDIPGQMGRELRSYGANLVVVPQGDTAIPDASVAAVDALVPSDALVGRTSFRYETMRINSQPWTAAGADLAGLRSVRPYWLLTGAWPASGQVLIGRDVADASGLGVGSPVKLTLAGKDGKDVDHKAVVSGVLDAGDAEDGFIVMSRDDLDRIMGGDRGADVLEYSISLDAGALTSLATRITGGDHHVTATPVKRLARSETTVLTTLSALLLSVTVIVLALAMITVATTMMAVVAERRVEIGLKKAIGADARAIAADFLGEGLLLGAAGGLLGGLLGLGFAQVVSLQVFGRGISADWWLVPSAVVVSVLVTGLACLLPVRQASEVEPAIVLRGE